MMDFSNVQQSGGGNVALNDMQDGTMLICQIHLADKLYSDLNPPYLVKDRFDGKGLINWHYDLVAKMPVQYAGRTISGRRPVTASGQRERGVDYPGMDQDCLRGDRAVAAILAFDAMIKRVPANMSIDNYDALEARFCAVQVSTWQGRKCVQFLSPLRAKDKMTCEMLAERWRAEPAPAPQQASPQQASPTHPNYGTPPVQQPQWPAQNQQVWQAQQQAIQAQVHAVVQQAQQRQPVQTQMMPPPPPPAQASQNGWPAPQDADEDIPF